jgi:lipopolysaccharide transport system permease protein
LLGFLTWRDVQVRYKQTLLGASWAVLQPFAAMVVFSLFFGKVAKLPSGGTPYPLFVFSGLLTWTYFANAVTQAGQSVVANQNLITKIYFPRLFIPMGAVGASLVDFCVAFVMLLAMMAYYGVVPGWGLLLVPLMVLGLTTAALGVGLILAALTVTYRDVRYVVPFTVQLWMFATPTIYMQADAILDPRWQRLLPLNPAFGLISNFRNALLGAPIDVGALSLSLASSGLCLLVGGLYFRRVVQNFAVVI